ncbi:hypothetical protein BpHYR1_025976 [Brachionus plicatilis]|uniref:Uncharacterized protein n=1 Tax=Brachionus plicatilis TaxID=10195 RepID=A0A3M7P8I4_BRAPC|nr:hypothetical protein BpHYR1_025976 [Brachionus plicatilis]
MCLVYVQKWGSGNYQNLKITVLVGLLYGCFNLNKVKNSPEKNFSTNFELFSTLKFPVLLKKRFLNLNIKNEVQFDAMIILFDKKYKGIFFDFYVKFDKFTKHYSKVCSKPSHVMNRAGNI